MSSGKGLKVLGAALASAVGVAGLTVILAVGPADAASKGKSTPSPTPTATATATASPMPTATATPTLDPSAVLLTCSISGDYVVADYASGVLYEGAVLSDGLNPDGTPNVLATFGSGTHAKFLKSMLPQGIIAKVNMAAADGSVVASCDVNTGYYDPYN